MPLLILLLLHRRAVSRPYQCVAGFSLSAANVLPNSPCTGFNFSPSALSPHCLFVQSVLRSWASTYYSSRRSSLPLGMGIVRTQSRT
ncbi:hypothetical protein B0H14DRAFT_2929453 [Mycena olivaceomarginata]|nr:hypothetical protein B0H14DRAFT_2929453 [Mycena olivaceomarginata]